MSQYVKIRNSKSEIRKDLGFQKSKPGNEPFSGSEFVLDFQFRISDSFRISDFGFRILLVLICLSTSILVSVADSNLPPDDALSSLKPPRAEILPTFWEQYGAWIIFGVVLLLAGVVFTVWLKTRPKPATPVPFAVVAREQLEQLRPQPESGAVLSWSSQILRHYIAAAFALPADEATTTEFSRRLQECEKIGPALANQIGDFLRECDLRKFAPSAPAPPFGAVSRSLSIIESSEARLAELNRVDAASAAASDSSSAAGEQGLASGAKPQTPSGVRCL
jgi:hypothetical protein